LYRQDEGKGCSRPHFARDLNPAGISLDKIFADHQAEPYPFRLGGKKWLKDFVHVLRRDPFAGVLNADFNTISGFGYRVLEG